MMHEVYDKYSLPFHGNHGICRYCSMSPTLLLCLRDDGNRRLAGIQRQCRGYASAAVASFLGALVVVLISRDAFG